MLTVTELPDGGGAVFQWTRGNHAMHKGPIEVPVRLRTVREDMDGVIEPVEQVLGWNYDRQTYAGEWNDKYLGTDNALNTWRAFEAMVKRGRRVRVEFQQQTYVGLIVSFTPKYKRPDYIEYSFDLSVHSSPSIGTDTPGVITQVPTSPGDAADELDELVAQMNPIHTDVGGVVDETGAPSPKPKFQVKGDVFSRVGAALRALASNVASAKSAVEQGVDNDPRSILRLAQRFQGLASSAAELRGNFGSMRSDTDLGFQHAISVLEFEQWSRGLATDARLTHRAADDNARAIAKRAKPGKLALYRPHKGENVYAISQRFYGTPFEWRRLLDVNHITTTEFTGIEVLVIPDL